MPRIGIPASWWKRIAGAYSPRRHHWPGWVITVPFGPIVLESRVKTWYGSAGSGSRKWQRTPASS